MGTISHKQLVIEELLNGFDSTLEEGIEKILRHGLSDQQWMTRQLLPGDYGGFRLRSGKLIAGAHHVISLQKWANDMASHNIRWECLLEAEQLPN